MLPGLYIHIPFCRTKCPYCNFYSVASISRIDDFMEALSMEMEMNNGKWGQFDTIYLGGGTPSLLSSQQIEKILTTLRNNFCMAPHTEITLEANPADLHLSYLLALREAGVNRLNLGVQSFEQEALKFLARRHSIQQAISAIETSRQAGFSQLGLDLIYGVPGQTIGSWLKTLAQALAFSPEHLSCYQLTVEKDTPLEAAYHRGEFSSFGEEELFDFFMITAERLEKAGFIQYEVSNFAREAEFASRHNQKYWDHTPYLGLGPSAHSYSGGKRWWNCRSVSQYIDALKAGKSPIQGSENLSLEQLQMEALFLGFRTRKGILIEDLCEKYQYDLISEKGGILGRLQEEGFLSIEDGRLHPTRNGLAVADSLVSLLSPSIPQAFRVAF